jgi:phage/plasmid primase-like uncharacterized protein
MLDDAGVLHSLHYIAPDGSKWFLTGGRVAGCFYQIGETRGVICVGEGFATMATVHEATGHAAVAAINKSSLLAVAQSFRRRFPAAKIVLCADDDWMREREGKGNPGLTDARASAAAVGGVVAVPEFGGGRSDKDTDFNDMARVAGRDAVLACIRKSEKATADLGEKIDPAQISGAIRHGLDADIPVENGGARERRKKQRALPSEDALALAFASSHGDELRYVFLFGASGSNGPPKGGRSKKRWPHSTSHAGFATGIL